MSRRSRNRRALASVVAFAALLVLGTLMWRLTPRDVTPWLGTALPDPEPAADFALLDGSGRTVRLSDHHGRAVLVFFGYTQCPDVCPTTLYDLKRAWEQLPVASRDRLRAVFVSVDPERDTPEVVGRYVPYFHPDFVGLTGSPETIADVAARWGVAYEKIPAASPGAYTMSHTSSVFAVDRAGRLRLIYGKDDLKDTDGLVRDLVRLADGA